MGADGFVVFYGVRRVIQSESEISLIEVKKHSIQQLAQKHRLQIWWGNNYESDNTEPDGEYVLIGHKIGNFGIEGKLADSLSDDAFIQMMHDVKAKFSAAKIEEAPKLLFQMDPDF